MAAAISKVDLEFTLQALRNENTRTDGRKRSAFRRFGIRLGPAHGEVEVNFGPTRALAVCSGEIIKPPPERANEGKLAFHVEFGPIASPSFDQGRPSAQAISVANAVERLLKGSKAVDTEALCIVGGQKVWSIRVDVRALDDDGNLRDVCAIAALCSLLHFRKADVEVTGGGAHVYTAEERVPVPLSVHHIPVPVTFALFAEGNDKGSETTWILDPNRLEEAAMGGLLTVSVNQYGELCGLQKPGGIPVDFSLVEQCLEFAKSRAKELIEKIKREIEGDLERRKKARRNVHQRFSSAELLSVDWGEPGQQASGVNADSTRVMPPVINLDVPRQSWRLRAEARSRATAPTAEGPPEVSPVASASAKPSVAEKMRSTASAPHGLTGAQTTTAAPSSVSAVVPTSVAPPTPGSMSSNPLAGDAKNTGRQDAVVAARGKKRHRAAESETFAGVSQWEEDVEETATLASSRSQAGTRKAVVDINVEADLSTLDDNQIAAALEEVEKEAAELEEQLRAATMAELEEATVAAESEGRQALAELAGSLDGLDGVVTIDDDMAPVLRRKGTARKKKRKPIS